MSQYKEFTRVDFYVQLWNQLKPDVFVDSFPCLADALQWKFRRISETEVEARCGWKYIHDPWVEKGTTLHHFSLFLETMGKLFMHQIPQLLPPIFDFHMHMGTIHVFQQFKLRPLTPYKEDMIGTKNEEIEFQFA